MMPLIDTNLFFSADTCQLYENCFFFFFPLLLLLWLKWKELTDANRNTSEWAKDSLPFNLTKWPGLPLKTAGVVQLSQASCPSSWLGRKRRIRPYRFKPGLPERFNGTPFHMIGIPLVVATLKKRWMFRCHESCYWLRSRVTNLAVTFVTSVALFLWYNQRWQDPSETIRSSYDDFLREDAVWRLLPRRTCNYQLSDWAFWSYLSQPHDTDYWWLLWAHCEL